MNNLGLSLHEQRKFERAVTVHVEAARLFRRADDRTGVARALSNTGETLIELGGPRRGGFPRARQGREDLPEAG
ncbi:hypothetical protein [Streptomyces alboflavus]|uniref:hypothetical protein n=1 Tax=Streptomyces alboflavus TaxID=67267 RepID=UPI00368748DA